MAKYSVTITPVDNFAGHSKVRYGVGEELEISVVEDPVPSTPTAMEWSVKSGKATVTNSGTTGAAKVKCGSVGGAVVLELKNTAGNAVLASKRFQVVAPSDVIFKQVGTSWHVNGMASAGFKAAIYLSPKDVSFKWVTIREGAAPWEGSGCLEKAKPIAVSGTGKFSETVIHPVLGTWIKAKAGGNSANGTLMSGQDTVRTGTPKTGRGELTWRIPWFYKVIGATTEYQFCVGVHHAEIDDAGKTTMTKFNVSVTKNKADASSG
jgi:hypothetical protein